MPTHYLVFVDHKTLFYRRSLNLFGPGFYPIQHFIFKSLEKSPLNSPMIAKKLKFGQKQSISNKTHRTYMRHVIWYYTYITIFWIENHKEKHNKKI